MRAGAAGLVRTPFKPTEVAAQVAALLTLALVIPHPFVDETVKEQTSASRQSSMRSGLNIGFATAGGWDPSISASHRVSAQR